MCVFVKRFILTGNNFCCADNNSWYMYVVLLEGSVSVGVGSEWVGCIGGFVGCIGRFVGCVSVCVLVGVCVCVCVCVWCFIIYLISRFLVF